MPSARRSGVRANSGKPLEAGVRAEMEAKLGQSFEDVRVHTGPDASTAAKSVQAQAFTVGQDVVFNDGKYAPSSPEGQRTIAHELSAKTSDQLSQGCGHRIGLLSVIELGLGAGLIFRRAPSSPGR